MVPYPMPGVEALEVVVQKSYRWVSDGMQTILMSMRLIGATAM